MMCLVAEQGNKVLFIGDKKVDLLDKQWMILLIVNCYDRHSFG